MDLHHLIDWNYGAEGDAVLAKALAEGADPEQRTGPLAETLLHVATRRRRKRAVEILLDQGADIDATTAGGKTAYAHAARRGFTEISRLLERRGADTSLTEADRLAVALTSGRLDEAEAILAAAPGVARTGNVEEDRLLADLAGRGDTAPVRLLITAGADLSARALDGGTALHQAAWFGQPQQARLLIEAGAPLADFGDDHQSSPLGWAVHGSRYSGDAENRQEAYVSLVRMLLEAGATLDYPEDPGGDRFRRRLLEDASPLVREILETY